ncbi:hypothetical protein K443DRAFT_3277 [Laccaria amethystina LaAM-08-1]|uniref:Peptidase S53 activation domain-containing protein n=1 Tax=Laccaria amethystina LaAM-08-1 TaxID=1095629 RepID=A0A0C9XMA6_9AGAR|nr:hypothetical protein K443DRAFT_3277 [Laccaria amethystina LaAM-08-1]
MSGFFLQALIRTILSHLAIFLAFALLAVCACVTVAVVFPKIGGAVLSPTKILPLRFGLSQRNVQIYEALHARESLGHIKVNATVAEVEKFLSTEYHVHAHPFGNEQFGCQNYSVPDHIQPHIDLIKPTVRFNHRPSPKARNIYSRRLRRSTNFFVPQKIEQADDYYT